MLNKRSLTIFASTFALVLLAGAAFAQVGSWAPSAPDENASVSEPLKVTTTTTEAVEEEVDETTSTTEHEDEVDETTTTTQHKDEEEEKADEVTDDDPPDLVILFPENGQHFDRKEVVFEGRAEPGSKVAAGPYVADQHDHGNWRIVLVLSEGANKVTFTATDEAGNKTHASVTVHYDKPKPKEEPVHKEFTAHQKWGENDQAEDIFWGTGIAGDKVWIVSEYGTTTTHVNSDGAWEVKATWEGIPNNTEIGIVIEASNGRKEFSFYKIGPVEEESEEHEFTANQQYGSCGEEEPYDVFWGTAAPGATVYVVSDFGSRYDNRQ